MADTLPEVDDETLSVTLGYGQTKELVDTLSDSLP